MNELLAGVVNDLIIQVQTYNDFINNGGSLPKVKARAERQLESIVGKLTRLPAEVRDSITRILRAAAERVKDPATLQGLKSAPFRNYFRTSFRPEIADKGKLFVEHFLDNSAPSVPSWTFDDLVPWLTTQHRSFISQFDQTRANMKGRGAERKKRLVGLVKTVNTALFAFGGAMDNGMSGPLAEQSKLVVLWAATALPVGRVRKR